LIEGTPIQNKKNGKQQKLRDIHINL